MMFGIKNCIALGEGAVVTKDYQLALRTRIHPNGDFVQFETIMTPEEYEIVYRVVRRLAEGINEQRT